MLPPGTTLPFGPADILTPGVLWAMLAAATVLSLAAGAVFSYHWHRYGLRQGTALTADIAFFCGLMVLLGLAATTLTLIP